MANKTLQSLSTGTWPTSGGTSHSLYGHDIAGNDLQFSAGGLIGLVLANVTPAVVAPGNVVVQSLLSAANSADARNAIGAASFGDLVSLNASLKAVAFTGNAADLTGPAFMQSFLQATTKAAAQVAIGSPGDTFGTAVIGTDFTLANNTTIQTTTLTFTAPVKGSYWVDASPYLQLFSGYAGVYAYIYNDSTSTQVCRRLLDASDSGSELSYGISGVVTTTAANQTVSLRLSKLSKGGSVYLKTADSKMNWFLISAAA